MSPKFVRIVSIAVAVILVVCAVFAVLYTFDFFESESVSNRQTDASDKQPEDSHNKPDDSDKQSENKDNKSLIEEKGGSVIVYETKAESPDDEQMEYAERIIRTRLDGLGYAEATVTRQDERKIKVEIPYLTEPRTVSAGLGATAKLEFIDYQGNVILTGKDIEHSSAKYGAMTENGEKAHYIEITFSEEGAKKFAAATERISSLQGTGNNYISILMDGIAVSAPSVTEKISVKDCVITGNFDKESAESLAVNIKAGQLPFELSVYSEEVVSPQK